MTDKAPERVIAALLILLMVAVAYLALTHRAPAQTRTGAFPDPSLCQESSPTPPFLTHGGVYRDRLRARLLRGSGLRL